MKLLAPRVDASGAGRERLANVASAPATPSLGEIYFDTGTNLAYVCTNVTGPVWSSIISAGSADWKDSVRVATVGTEAFTVAAGSVTQITGTVIDGITVAINDRVLVKDAPAATGVGSPNSTQPGNGIYIVTGNTTNLTLARATDADGVGEMSAATVVSVEGGGTVNANTMWSISTPVSGSVTPGTTAILWSTKDPRELGTAAAPSYSFVGDSNTGMFSPGADQVALAAGGTAMLQISATGMGFFGTAPAARLTGYGAGAMVGTKAALTAGSTLNDVIAVLSSLVADLRTYGVIAA